MAASIDVKPRSSWVHGASRNAGDPYTEERIDLAAAFRWTARLGMHEAIANHFSLAVSDDRAKFLMNPNGRHFSRMRASELVLFDLAAPDANERARDADPTAWAIHGAIHRNVPAARCVLHCHPKYATVIASLRDSTIYPIDQNTMRFYERVAIDEGYDGMGFGDEAERLSRAIGNNSVAILGNHGVVVVGPTVAHAFDELYYFERACETLVTAYTTGKPLRVVEPAVAAKTRQQWLEYLDYAENHFRELKRILDDEEPDYRE
jgi:ribulose-5-phosphate 4-epimerase/fuculose-1-phosphate aldolase